MAATPQLLGVVVAAAVLITVAFAVDPSHIRVDRPAPQPWQVGVFAFLALSAFVSARYLLSGWSIVAFYVLIFALVTIMVVRWSTRIDGAPPIALQWQAVPADLRLHAFPQKPVIGSTGSIDLVGNAVFAIVAVILLLAASRTVRLAVDASTDVVHTQPEV